MSNLDALVSKVRSIQDQMNRLPVLRWATVTSAYPLRIQLDGDAQPLLGTPDTLVANLAVGSRVEVALQHGRAIIQGRGGGSGAEFPTASYLAHGGSDILDPAEWLLAEGQAVSRTTYARLYDAIGTFYGPGNQSTTFNLPDARGRTLVGLSSDTEFNTLGKKFGTKTHTLTVAEMPNHRHSFEYPYGSGSKVASLPHSVSFGAALSVVAGGAEGAHTGIATEGGNEAHNNIQPSLVARIYIKT